MHELWVPGRPLAKQRPRMTRRGRVYTPEQTSAFEDVIADLWDGPLYEGPVAVDIDYTPAGQMIRVRQLDDLPPSKLRADVDNYAKLSLDGLQKGGAFLNDKQVHDLTLSKR